MTFVLFGLKDTQSGPNVRFSRMGRKSKGASIRTVSVLNEGVLNHDIVGSVGIPAIGVGDLHPTGALVEIRCVLQVSLTSKITLAWMSKSLMMISLELAMMLNHCRRRQWLQTHQGCVLLTLGELRIRRLDMLPPCKPSIEKRIGRSSYNSRSAPAQLADYLPNSQSC
jgi:hypothetical protein